MRVLARRFLTFCLALLPLGYALAPEARASVSIPIAFDDLVRESSAAVVATPELDQPVWEDGRIITYTKVHIDALVAGSLGDVPDTWVRTRGGEIGHVGQSVAGEAVLTVGRPSLLFLRPPHAGDAVRSPFVVTARAQGQFPVVQGAHDLELRASFDAPGAAATSAAPLARGMLHGRTVVDAESRIAGAWDRLHAH